MHYPLVSAIIPTYNRRDDVVIAVRTAVAQTYPPGALEVIVVDDGGTDDTAEVLARTFGDRVRVLRKPNGGVSSARNHGLSVARGEYLALLDSDDEWLPTKIEKQVAFLEGHAGFGMVVTDVEFMCPARLGLNTYRRRNQLPEDGLILHHVLRNPRLTPASAMITRAVLADSGGFDESLRTAEDIDFHLRVAAAWPIGVIEETLTRVMRDHEGLSNLACTNRDYVDVIERFARDHELEPHDRDAALLEAYTHNARGMLWDGEVAEALRICVRGAARARSIEDARKIAGLGIDLAKGLAVHLRRRIAAISAK